MQPASRQNLPAYQKLQQHPCSRFLRNFRRIDAKNLPLGAVYLIRVNRTLTNMCPIQASLRCRRARPARELAICLEGGIGAGDRRQQVQGGEQPHKDFTKAKMKQRLEQIDESIARYLSQLDTADRQGPTGAGGVCSNDRSATDSPMFRKLSARCAACRQVLTTINALPARTVSERPVDRCAAAGGACSIARTG